MNKVLISVYECKPGMRIAEDIYNEYGAVIVVEDTVLNDYIIERIQNLDLVKVRVYEGSNEIVAVNKKELFKAQYDENVNTIKSILNDISSGKRVDSGKINQVTNSALSRINENRDIVDCINEMRAADEYLYTHSINVSLLAMLIGKWLKYDYRNLKALVTSGFLHDIGKIRIASEILNKPTSLNREEYDEIKNHCVYGFKITETIPELSDDIRKGILMHHEREDGSGYPFGLKGDQIHDFSKIIAVADIYDAMTSNRAYKSKTCPFDVIESIEKDNFKTLDQRVVGVFLNNLASYYTGDYVMLNTGSVGEIVYINPFNISKPIIKANNAFIDLSTNKKVKIVELL